LGQAPGYRLYKGNWDGCMENNWDLIIAYMDTSVLKYIHVHTLETTPQPPKDI